jgi:hypothetical protein
MSCKANPIKNERGGEYDMYGFTVRERSFGSATKATTIGSYLHQVQLFSAVVAKVFNESLQSKRGRKEI